MPTKTKRKSANPPAFFPMMKGQKRTHTETFRWVEDFQVSSRHRREGQYMPVNLENPMMLSTYILDEIFGEKGAELPKEIKITVEW